MAIETPVELITGEDCEADRLRYAGFALAIANPELRFWGGERSSDHVSLHVTVIFDKIIEALFEAQKDAIDKNASILGMVIETVRSLFLRDLKDVNVLAGYEVFFDPKLNTEQSAQEGIFYIVEEIQEMPLVKRLVNKVYRGLGLGLKSLLVLDLFMQVQSVF